MATEFFRIIYSVNNSTDISELKRLNLPKELSMHEFKGQSHPLDELDVLITGGCGNGFIHKMQSRQVTVIATSEEEPLTAVKNYVTGKQLPPAKPHHH